VLALGNLCPAERPIASTLNLLLKEGFYPRVRLSRARAREAKPSAAWCIGAALWGRRRCSFL
jgi:hypothetical protein